MSRRILWLLALLPAVASPRTAGENRRWLAELEVRGPLRGFVLDCGPEGRTIVELVLTAGEVTRLVVPVPVRSPLGERGLASLPVPALLPLAASAPVPASASGSELPVRWLGFREGQPEEPPPALLARPLPPLGGAEAGRLARPHELLLALVVVLLGLGLRRRPRAAVLGLLLGSVGVGASTLAGRPAGVRTRAVLEADGGLGLTSLVTRTRDPAEVSGGTVEVEPPGSLLVVRTDGGGERATFEASPGAHLILRGEPRPLEAAGDRNPFGDLAEAWSRDASGAWRALGAWPKGSLRPAGGEGRAGAPPGWLSSGLPPGRTVWLGRLAAGGAERWLRAVGFGG